MHMAVNQARHDGQAGGIDALRIFGYDHGGCRPGRDDPAVIIDDDRPVGDDIGRSAIEQTRAENDAWVNRRGHCSSEVGTGGGVRDAATQAARRPPETLPNERLALAAARGWNRIGTGLQPEPDRVGGPLVVLRTPRSRGRTVGLDLFDRAVHLKHELPASGQRDLAPLVPTVQDRIVIRVRCHLAALGRSLRRRLRLLDLRWPLGGLVAHDFPPSAWRAATNRGGNVESSRVRPTWTIRHRTSNRRERCLRASDAPAGAAGAPRGSARWSPPRKPRRSRARRSRS